MYMEVITCKIQQRLLGMHSSRFEILACSTKDREHSQTDTRTVRFFRARLFLLVAKMHCSLLEPQYSTAAD